MPTPRASRGRGTASVSLLLLLLTPPGGSGLGWMTNDGTASESLVVGSSGTTPSGSPPLERMKPFMAVDGDVATQWNAAVDSADKSCWLVLDFGSEVTIEGLALVQRGDITHDAKDHELQTAATQDGPWQSAGSFVGQECKPPTFSARQCRGPNQPGAAAFRQTFELPSPATSRYFRWVAKTRFSEYQLYLYEIQFRFSAWGAVTLLLLCLCSCAYVSGGVALGVKTEGKPWRLSSHPHLPRWLELYGLVCDGLAYTRAVAAGRTTRSGRETATQRGHSKGRGHYGATQQAASKAATDRRSKGSKRSKGKELTASLDNGDQADERGTDERGSASASASTAAAGPGSHAAGASPKVPGRWVHVPG
jgi:hypothetical protein